MSGLFGGPGRKLKRFRPVNISSGGLNATFDQVGKNQFNLNLGRGEGAQSAITDLSRGLADRSAAFGELRGRVAPGFGELTRGRVQAIRDAGRRTVGNLRNRLRQRRVLGSSFAENQIAGVEEQFSRAEAEERATGTISEIGLTGDLIEREFSGAIEAAAALLDQFNFESSVASGLQQSGTNALLSVAQARAALRAQRDEGIGSLIGTISGSGGLGNFIKGFF